MNVVHELLETPMSPSPPPPIEAMISPDFGVSVRFSQVIHKPKPLQDLRTFSKITGGPLHSKSTKSHLLLDFS
jgi:hypothetical protein